MGTTRFKTPLTLILVVSSVEFLNFLIGPFGMAKGKTIPDFLFLLLLVFHVVWAYRLIRGSRKETMISLFRTPEVLFVATLVLFLLSYIFASNANMSYVQRFAAMKGNIRLAPDSAIQRLNSISRYVPLFGLQVWAIVLFRVRKPWLAARAIGSAHPAATWGLLLALLSALLYTFAFPSFLSIAGWGPLAFIALVPLFVVFYKAPYGRSVFYGVAFGVVETMLTNFWLGTFSLVSLQFITIVMLIEFTLFMLLMLLLFKRLPWLGYLIFPIAWVAFDWLKSLGFLGYPWGMIGVTQYEFTRLIQIASITGVWGVSFVVTGANSVIAHALQGLWRSDADRVPAAEGSRPARRRLFLPVWSYAGLLIVLLVFGSVAMLVQSQRTVDHRVKIALVQQNTDPRKNDYADTFRILERLTNDALFYNPDLVVWSETAFVPNIRKWSALDPKVYPLSKLVDEFLAYQKSTGHWLLTGNDDYFESTDAAGKTVRQDFNASVLFSPSGQRVETYHKIHLVPFTEYFPYKKQLPFLYNMLLNFDVYLWEPGTRHVVFKTPKLTFSTPICFEDAFPDDVRQFVVAGAQVIMNISNDYWSLTPVEGKQHYINSL
ncbi:MAG TPA: apolipoprotein N-acyltransferase, partial [Spirochaetia bacterium]|nr:apolipoprotein N-acyltransferase [Spirochaetia bacterium]